MFKFGKRMMTWWGQLALNVCRVRTLCYLYGFSQALFCLTDRRRKKKRKSKEVFSASETSSPEKKQQKSKQKQKKREGRVNLHRGYLKPSNTIWHILGGLLFCLFYFVFLFLFCLFQIKYLVSSMLIISVISGRGNLGQNIFTWTSIDGSAGVYVPYMYSHARWVLPWATRVFVVCVMSFERSLTPLFVLLILNKYRPFENKST